MLIDFTRIRIPDHFPPGMKSRYTSERRKGKHLHIHQLIPELLPYNAGIEKHHLRLESSHLFQTFIDQLYDFGGISIRPLIVKVVVSKFYFFVAIFYLLSRSYQNLPKLSMTSGQSRRCAIIDNYGRVSGDGQSSKNESL
jgi:hypothetical protein